MNHKKLLLAVFFLTVCCYCLLPTSLFAGNKDRIGQSGASELLINPWAGSTGLGGANSASVMGIESMHLNVAGLAYTNKTDITFAHTNWLKGSDIGINTLGLAVRTGESSVLGIGVMAMNFGDIDITTVNLPEGGSGKFSPQFLNFGLSYAREFSNSISGGITTKVISESISNVKAQGVAFDLGVRYVTGDKKHMKFGIALRNVGPKMKYAGDGMSTQVYLDGKQFTLEQRSEGFELPAFLSIGAAYDIYVAPQTDSATKEIKADHKITLCGNFQANSFGKDQIRIGAEYGFMNYFKVRAGYVYEEATSSVQDRTTVYTGPTAGVSVQLPFSGKTIIGLDYSYQNTFPFDGTHTFGIRINI